jgi:hypothetical protein
MHSYKAPDPRKDSLDLARRRRTTLGVRADQHRLAARGPGHGDVTKGVLAVVAGLVADPPAFGQAGAQPVVSGLATQHPACEALAGVWPNGVAKNCGATVANYLALRRLLAALDR